MKTFWNKLWSKVWNKYLLIAFAVLLILGAIIAVIVTKHNGTF